MNVDGEGAIDGTVLDPDPDPDVDGSVTGSANDIVGCSPQAPGRTIHLEYTLDRTLATLTALRRGKGGLAGGYDTGNLSFVVTRAND